MKDPICGMKVKIRIAKKQNLYFLDKYFCSVECKSKYKGKYIEGGLSLSLILIAILVFINGYMIPFMGTVFLILASLKLLDLRGFSERFVKYDLIAKKNKWYAHIYPFIELGLAMMFLFNNQIRLAALITFLVMGVGSVGVVKNLFSKDKVQCACLGAKINVPLTRFTLVENIIMVIMALMIFFMF